MKGLTRQEQFVVWAAMLLLLTCWAIKTYRTAHPPEQWQTPEKPGK